jgi:hypothetical protein
MQQFQEDYNQSIDEVNYTLTVWLNSLDEGDTLIIKDTIANLAYDELNHTTKVTFTSQLVQQVPTPLQFEGDITEEFSLGDTVTVTTHIINVTMTYFDPQSGQNVTYHFETFKESWDVDSRTGHPFPQSIIEQAEESDNDNGDISQKTSVNFYEFMSDYVQNTDNQTLTATTYLKSFDDGDTVIIEDRLQNLNYNATEDVTALQFTSYPQLVGIVVEGNITNEFHAGDTVILTSEIINTTFTHSYGGQDWTLHYETFAEGWDTNNNTVAPFPHEALRHADQS